MKVKIISLILLGMITYVVGAQIQTAIAKRLTVSCKRNFTTQQEAQNYYDTRQKGYTHLYVNADGKVCTTLP